MPIEIWIEYKPYKERNVKNEKYTYKEQLQYNEKDWNLENIPWPHTNHIIHAKILTHVTQATHAKISTHSIFFDIRQTFLNPHHPRQPPTLDLHLSNDNYRSSRSQIFFKIENS